MAEIHVQAKKHSNASPAWIWIVVGLLIAAAVIYFLTRNNKTNAADNNHTGTTSFVQWNPAASPAVEYWVN